MKKFSSTKTFCHSEGLSAAFRQWRSAPSHCSLIHGYALEVKFTFTGDLDDRNWIVNFGGLKDVKAWLKNNFDHKLLVAADDPELPLLRKLNEAKVAEIVVVPAVGCERFAELIFDYVSDWLAVSETTVVGDKAFSYKHQRVRLASVEVREHAGNSAIVSV